MSHVSGIRNLGLLFSALTVSLLVGCQTPSNSATTKPAVAAASPATPAAKPAAGATADAAKAGIIRIKAGQSTPFKDSAGNTWMAQTGFADGDDVERADDLKIENTKDPAMYHSEHYGMSAFSYKVPNGKYKVNLYFAETYEGISGPGERVFSFKVEGQAGIDNFDVFKAAGGADKALVESYVVNVTDGKLDIAFTSITENPEINAIEIIPS